MLAKIDWNTAPCDAPALPDYSGFPFWEAFVAEPNKERKVCDFLHEKLGIDLYWPRFAAKRRRRGSFYVACMKSVIPGILLAPVEFLAVRDRDRILDWVHLRPLRLARPLTKAEIEEVRNMEAALNIPVPESGPLLTVGQQVGFVSDIYAEKLVEAVVLEIASGGRIRIRSKGKLIGGIDTFWISCAELEAK